MYKRQIYQIAESNRIEKIDSVTRIESNRNFFPRIGMHYPWERSDEIAHKRIRQLRSVYTKLGLHAIWQPYGGIVSFFGGGILPWKDAWNKHWLVHTTTDLLACKQLDDRIHHLPETKPHHFSNIFLPVTVNFDLWPWGPIYKISYDLSQDYRKVYRKIHWR